MIRKGLPKDCGFVADLSVRAFSRYGPYELILPDYLSDSRICTLIALENDRPAGFGMLFLGGDIGELLAIAVEPDFQKQGNGRALMQTMLLEAEKHGCKAIVLKTAEDNRIAQNLFRSFDFEIAGEDDEGYSGGQTALRMVKYM